MYLRGIVLVATVALAGCMSTDVPSDMGGSGGFFETLESDVFQTQGKAPEIAQRGQACMMRLLQNNAVVVHSDSASNTVPGGQVIISSDIPGGTIVATQRLNYTGRNLIPYALQSTVTLEARDGRFRLIHTNIAETQTYTGFAATSGLNRIRNSMGYADVPRDLLGKLSLKLADCVRQSPAQSNW